MTCFICKKPYLNKRVSENAEEYCNECNLYKTKKNIKNLDSYKSEFWEETDYSEFTGSDFTDDKVKNLVLTFESWYSYFRVHLKTKDIILDIGSGTGISCILLEKKGYNLIGVDPDPKNVELINSKLKKGKCINAFFEDLKIEKKVNVIWITHIIEHLEQPDELLKRCKEWLTPDGIICIAVPDCENLGMLRDSLTNPYHMFHFSRKSLRKMFEKCGYDILKCDSLSVLEKTNRRIHKVIRKFGLKKISSRIEPYYPFEITTGKNGYEIRCIIKLKNE